MNKPKPSAAQQAAELKSIELLPVAEGKKRTDALLRNMFATPPDPRVASEAKPKQRARK